LAQLSLPLLASSRDHVMSSGGSVTHWISALKGGDAAAAEKLWERYFCRLVGLARKRRLASHKLGNEELRSIAVWKMEGYSNPEIAARLGRAVATVERRLRLIRKRWEGEGAR
jgi:DNA-binding NarL/FixJ family response regulator